MGSCAELYPKELPNLIIAENRSRIWLADIPVKYMPEYYRGCNKM